jgi:hypothetical protein
MDLSTFAFTCCKAYVRDQKGHIDDEIIARVLGWIRARDINRLCNASDYIEGAYQCLHLCRFTRQVQAFFKKNPAFSNPQICYKAAEHAFERAELLCRITNKRLDHYYFHQDRIDPEVRAVLVRAEHILSGMLGDVTAFIEDIPRLGRVTSGASATRGRRTSLPHLKVRTRGLPATKSAIPWLRHVAAVYGYDRMTFRETDSNRVTTVRKNWKTDRTIACEPEGNLFLQLAFDGFIKDRMRKHWHLDLSDQSKNQDLAREGSIDNSLATIDLSMASDTVSLNAVAWLLPPRWYDLLRAMRSPYGDGFGKRYRYAKLSSMGNGATFALETMVFAALSKATTAKVTRCYGDDIIISKAQGPLLVKVLRFLGFRVNTDKSYLDGPFRESCGADWFLGSNVTPFYLRAASSTKTELCHIVNGLAPLTHPGGDLANMLCDLVAAQKLPLVPWNWSSISGVWVYPSTAYSLKLIRTKNGLSKVLAFTSKTGQKKIADSRTLFLWHLSANRREERGYAVYQRHFIGLYTHTDPWTTPVSSIISSSVPTFTHKFVRKWVCWHPPAMVTPGHLYWWTDQLVRSNTG